MEEENQNPNPSPELEHAGTIETEEEPHIDTNTEIIEAIEKAFDKDVEEQEDEGEKKDHKQDQELENSKADKSVSIGTSAIAVVETQEVVSSSKPSRGSTKSRSGSRRSSYQASRSHVSGFQNYGLAHLPYKSNFEPSEDARRRADEFFKTLKL